MRPLTVLAFCIIWLAALPAAAKTTAIDDSGTLPHDAALTMRWREATPRGPNTMAMVGTLSLRVKLDVSPWMHRAGRIYLALPVQSPAP